jgi:hypothetical protein
MVTVVVPSPESPVVPEVLIFCGVTVCTACPVSVVTGDAAEFCSKVSVPPDETPVVVPVVDPVVSPPPDGSLGGVGVLPIVKVFAVSVAPSPPSVAGDTVVLPSSCVPLLSEECTAVSK